MLRKIIVLFCISFFANSLFSAESFEDKRIEKIEFIVENLPKGESYDTKTILSRLKTKDGEPFSQLVFDNDLKMLSEDFDKVIPNITISNDHLIITLKVWLRSFIREISWVGNNHMKTSKLQKELGYKVGSAFNRYNFTAALNKVKELYVKEGFFESQITYDVTSVGDRNNEVSITIHVEEGRSGKVRNIAFEGVSKDEESDLRNLLYTRKYFFLTSWLTGDGFLNSDAIEQDRLAITTYLQNKGFADAKVDLIFLDAPNGGVIVKFKVERGIIYKLGSISFDGNKIIPNADIEKVIICKSGELFALEKIRGCAQAIKDRYGQKGYIDAEVNFDTILSENEPIYNVIFHIDENREYKIGLIRIIGNKTTQSRVILRESLLVPGETFDSRKLERTQNKLSDIGYFKNVNVYAVKTDEEDNYRDVYIEVEETTTGHGSLSIGASSLDSVFGSVDITETNFNWRGLFCMFRDGPSALRGGGEYLKLGATIGAKQNSYLLSWFDPYFRDTLWRVGLELSKTFSQLQAKDYNTSTYGGSVSAAYPLTNYWIFGSRYRARHTKTHFRHHIKKWEEREFLGKDGFVSAISAYFTFDSLNRNYKPTFGLRSSLNNEFVGIGGNFTFWKLEQTNVFYHPIWSKGTMKYIADFRFIFPFNSTDKRDIPMSERFFLGGENSVRGYKPYILGPKLRHREEDPLGGISSTLLSVEYNQEIYKVMDAFVFFDAGCISDKKFAIPKLNTSYGIGLRLEISPRVPLMVGIGFPINPDRRSDVRKVFFSMGAQF